MNDLQFVIRHEFTPFKTDKFSFPITFTNGATVESKNSGIYGNKIHTVRNMNPKKALLMFHVFKNTKLKEYLRYNKFLGFVDGEIRKKKVTTKEHKHQFRKTNVSMSQFVEEANHGNLADPLTCHLSQNSHLALAEPSKYCVFSATLLYTAT